MLCRLLCSCAEWGRLPSCSTRASLVAEPGPQSPGSAVAVHRLRCPEACGIFLDQGPNSCLLHWQADSSPPCHQGSPLPHLHASPVSHALIKVWTMQRLPKCRTSLCSNMSKHFHSEADVLFFSQLASNTHLTCAYLPHA